MVYSNQRDNRDTYYKYNNEVKWLKEFINTSSFLEGKRYFIINLNIQDYPNIFHNNKIHIKKSNI